jgi:hypothetical protein
MNPLSPKVLLRVEGAVILFLATYLYHAVGGSWILFAVLFLAPDLSMVGFLFGVRTGARVYNAAHNYFVPVLLGAIGYVMSMTLLLVGIIWVAHIGFDRLLGYGLKYETGFKDTHLGRV